MRELGIVTDFEGAIADGFKGKVVEFACVIGLAAYMPEAILARLMADNRLMSQWVEAQEDGGGIERPFVYFKYHLGFVGAAVH
eukprot:2692238-Amphidinium_carterae.1